MYTRVFPCRLAVIDVELCGSTVYFSRDDHDDIFDLEHWPTVVIQEYKVAF